MFNIYWQHLKCNYALHDYSLRQVCVCVCVCVCVRHFAPCCFTLPKSANKNLVLTKAQINMYDKVIQPMTPGAPSNIEFSCETFIPPDTMALRQKPDLIEPPEHLWPSSGSTCLQSCQHYIH